MKKLTEKQREELIRICIDSDIEACYKYRDRFTQLYEGIVGYKEISDEELLEQVSEFELIEDFLLEDWLNANK